ncbi:hypothetical protein N8I77_003436 [Diaporthe amygdali]|uniref:Uncharacterized protein n=1 Tax=Phomopsis amygdali TaxID=1214568 RepID=A0AAD9SLD6_PHOAM|nr:hypothetical protein N8I77_003436 [Diaporthe amygdali]
MLCIPHTTTVILALLFAILTFVSTGNCSDMTCFHTGIGWDELGTWDEIVDALMKDPIYDTAALGENTDAARSKIKINGHCLIYDITASKGYTDMNHIRVTNFLRKVYDSCHDHGGVLKLFSEWDDANRTEFWVKGDPQRSSDCS